MKKYIKPMTAWTRMDNEMLMEGSGPIIDPDKPAWEGGSSKDNKNFSIWNLDEEESEDESGY